MEKYDIVIIGGGVAGLSTALHLSEEIDATLLLIDKGTVGDPTRTSPFTFPDVVTRFNLHGAVLQEYTKFTYRSPTGVTASFEFEKPSLVTLDYSKTCGAILDQIRKEGTVQVSEKTEATGLETDKFTHTLELALPNSSSVSCNVLVDASGRDFFTLRQLGIRLPSLYSHPYGELLERCRIEDPKEMCIFSGKKYGNGGGWLYPIDKTTARFGFATVTRSNHYPKRLVESNFRDATQHFYPYNEMLAGAKRRRREFGTIPIEPLQRFVYGRILLVGDAAGQATPWYCEGIRPALESGEMCAKVIAEAFKKETLRSKVFNEYQQLWDAENRSMYSRVRPWSYFRSQEQWDDSVRYQASLTPDKMLAAIRYFSRPSFRSKLFSRSWRARPPTEILKEMICGLHDKVRGRMP